jgi:GntR family transcriptional regulator, transcriptional repressor for pyruvate dehydrogenase complex
MPDGRTTAIEGAGTRPKAASGLSPITGRVRAAREIVESLQADIASGRLPLGSRLPSERNLAKHFDVSQPTVREAVRALDLMGLVDVRHGSGVYVTGNVTSFLATSLRTLLQVERVTLTEVLDIRVLLGGYSARLAAQHVTDDEISNMEAYLDACDTPGPDAGPRELLAAAVSFQLAVSAAARNPLLFAIENFLIKLASQWQLTAFGDEDRDFWVDRVHSYAADRRRLLAFIVARDSEGAVSAMQTYLRTQFTKFSSDERLAALTVEDPASFVSLFEDVLPEFPARR